MKSHLPRVLFVVVFVAILIAWATSPPAIVGVLWLASAVLAALNAAMDRKEGYTLDVALWVVYVVMAVVCALIGLGVLERPRLPAFRKWPPLTP